PEAERPALLRELLSLELWYRRQNGERPLREEYRQRFPVHAQLVEAVFKSPVASTTTRSGEAPSSYLQATPAPEAAAQQKALLPVRLGRYRVQRVLGQGSFGVVYEAYDEELRRDVAVKVPHLQRVARAEAIEVYLAEARTLASLDHPHIVPVY